MSLIDDALRRAQAAQTPGTGAGSVLRVPMPLPDSGRYRRRNLRRLAAAALLTAAAIAGVFFFRRPTPREAPPQPLEASGSAASAAVAARASSRTPTPAATVTATASTSAAGDRTSAAATPAAGQMLRQTPVAPLVPAAATGPVEEPAAESARPTAAGPPSTAPPPPALREPRARTPVILPPIEVSNASGSPRVSEDERARPAPPPAAEPKPASRTRTYGAAANLPTGKLELEGIVFSETNPTALINGRVVAPGGYVDGYTVVKIGPDRVELTDDKTTIVLTLK